MSPRHRALILWAGREVLGQPGPALLMGLAIGLLTVMLAAGLLLSQALTAATDRLLTAGPDLVVRRVGPQGWRPVSTAAATAAMSIPGIIDARPRIWGTARASDRTVSVVAADDAALAHPAMSVATGAPKPGEAVVGRGVALAPSDDRLTLQAAADVQVRVVGRFPAEADLATHDLVMLHPREARFLLGLGADEASDLALTVFHPEEADALLAELSRTFPWPVHIATRNDTRKHYAAAFGRRGGLGAVLYLPAAVAMALIVAAVVRQQMGGRRRVGLLKALGWTSGDIVTLQVAQSLLVGLPAIAAGLLTAYGLVYGPSPQWAGHLLLGWLQSAPIPHLEAGYAAPVFLEVTGMLLAPYLVAVLWSSLALAAAEPQDLLNGGHGS